MIEVVGADGQVINASQLCAELGGVALNVVHSDPPVIRADVADEQTLLAAVRAHVAKPEAGRVA